MEGQSLGPYHIDRELGSGAMGTVWEASAPDATPVALKVVHPHLVEQPGFRERFLREARAGLAIRSPNVVRTLDCIETEIGGRSVPVLVLELVDGRDLNTVLAESRQVPEELCRHLAREIATGLSAVHAAGLVHRDLKPENVLLTPAGDVKITDLGLARQAGGDDRLSQTGLYVGTAAYSPPEQFFGRKELDPRSDLYSLGALLFEMATGSVPFSSENIGDLIRQVLRDAPPRLGSLAPQTTPFFERVVATLLEKEPDRRFPTADALVTVLDDAEGGDWWAAAAVRVQLEDRRGLRRVRTRHATELWGREDDLAELSAAWMRAREGHGGVVLLEGEPGIGKTRLVEELLTTIETDVDARIVAARLDPGRSLGVLQAALVEHLDEDDLESRLGSLLDDVGTLVPALAAFLRGEPPPPAAPALTPEALQALFVRLVRRLSLESPLVVVVDDLHLADDLDRALFRALAAAVGDCAVLLVGTARPGLPQRWVDDVVRGDAAALFPVRRLDADTLRAAVARHLGAGWAAESVAEKVVSHAAGNPYFVVEILRQLREAGHLTRTDDGVWRVASVPAEVGAPETVRGLVAQRLAALSDDDFGLLRAAACQGHEFDGRLVAETLGVPALGVLRALGRLEFSSGVVRALGARFAFDHHIVREVLYEEQPDSLREENHRRIAASLTIRHRADSRSPEEIGRADCAELAQHLFRGASGQCALRYVEPAFAYHESRWSNRSAVDLLESALGVPDGLAGERRVSILCCLSNTAGRMGAMERAESAAREAVASSSGCSESLQILAWKRLAFTCLNVGRLDEAEAAYEAYAEAAARAGDGAAQGDAETGRGHVDLARRRIAEAEAHYLLALALARAAGDPKGEASAEGNLGCVRAMQGRPHEALASHEHAFEYFRSEGNLWSQADAAGNIAGALEELGRPVEAEVWYSRQLAISHETGGRRGQAAATIGLARLRWREGRTAEAREQLRHAHSVYQGLGAAVDEAHVTLLLGWLALEQPGGKDGEPLLRRAAALAAKAGQAHFVSAAHLGLGLAAAARGDHDAARRELTRARTAAEAIGYAGATTLASAYLATLSGGDATAALESLATNEGALAPEELREVRLALWKATGDRAHLEESRRLLDELLATNSPEHHESMLTNLRVNREIMAACREISGTRRVRQTVRPPASPPPERAPDLT